MKLHGNMTIRDNELHIGEISCTEIKEKYGTPIYIIDEKDFIHRARTYKDNFKSTTLDTEVIYASKALLNVYMAKLVGEQGLSIDVVSGGELYTVLKAGFPNGNIYFHGNNKLEEELKMAIDADIGAIVIDNRDEFENLKELTKGRGSKTKVMLRVNPGIEAHTHEYIKTSKDDSKFGESIYEEWIYDFIEEIDGCTGLDFLGLHCHIGSQVFEKKSFFKTAKVMMDFVNDIKINKDIIIKHLNLGGGFGVYYTKEDKPMELPSFLRELIEIVEDYNEELNLGIEKIYIEPGRSLISNSGSTLYTVGGTKKTYGGKEYVFIDGGMTDNPRPSLYQAKYEAMVANKANDEKKYRYTIAGKCCESGDVLIEDIELPETQRGDLILVPTTGAYTYSMSSNYNRIKKPGMIFINGKDVKIGVRRQTYEDLIRDDVF